MQASSTAGATSDMAGRLNKAIQSAEGRIGNERLQQLKAVQKKVDELAREGLLNRQHYSAATETDFKRLYMRQG
jgi:hypothetical protein